MMLEQLVTSGAITEICVWKLRRRYSKMCRRRLSQTHLEDVEIGVGAQSTGALRIGYYRPTTIYRRSHIKCSIIDDCIVVLGSGNMDRASWYTSQELGVAIEGSETAKGIWSAIEGSSGAGILHSVDWM